MKSTGLQEAQESADRNTARRHERHERRGDEEEARRRVYEEQSDDEHGRCHDLGPRVERVHRRGDGIELPEARHLRPPAGPFSASSVSSKAHGVSDPRPRRFEQGSHPYRRRGLRGVSVEHLGRGPDGAHPAIVQRAHPVCDLGDLVEVVGDEDDGDARVAQVPDQV